MIKRVKNTGGAFFEIGKKILLDGKGITFIINESWEKRNDISIPAVRHCPKAKNWGG
jgi:hypothetical protein